MSCVGILCRVGSQKSVDLLIWIFWTGVKQVLTDYIFRKLRAALNLVTPVAINTNKLKCKRFRAHSLCEDSQLHGLQYKIIFLELLYTTPFQFDIYIYIVYIYRFSVICNNTLCCGNSIPHSSNYIRETHFIIVYWPTLHVLTIKFPSSNSPLPPPKKNSCA